MNERQFLNVYFNDTSAKVLSGAVRQASLCNAVQRVCCLLHDYDAEL